MKEESSVFTVDELSQIRRTKMKRNSYVLSGSMISHKVKRVVFALVLFIGCQQTKSLALLQFSSFGIVYFALVGTGLDGLFGKFKIKSFTIVCGVGLSVMAQWSFCKKQFTMWITFYPSIHEVVDDPSLDATISWSKSNRSFIVRDPEALHREILPNYTIQFGRNYSGDKVLWI